MEGDFRIGEWLICPRLNTVQSTGPVTRIEHKCMQVLVTLAARPGEVVPKEQLMRAVWADTFVTDDVLTRAVSELRRILGDDARQPHIIETIAKSGYRLIAPVEREQTSSTPARGTFGKPATLGRNVLVASGLALIAVAITISVLFGHKPAATQTNRPQTIAVLPFQNVTGTKEFDFLRVGLADEIATSLSYYPALSIRPFTTANKYAGPDVDLLKAGEQMRVAEIVAGHFAVAGDKIEVSLEAVDLSSNSVVWRDNLQGTTQDLIGLHQQIAAQVQHGLIRALGVTTSANNALNASHNQEAYELYLRAVSKRNSTDSPDTYLLADNREAIGLLQRAVALDPGYASAWAALGHLYYYDSGNGDKTSRFMAKTALQRAVALDPNRLDAASDLINIESEEGQLNKAYDDITALLRERPDSGAVHLVYSYVLWYAGLLDEAAAECEKTRSLDAGTIDLASCYNVFMGLGKYERAKEFLQLVSGTEFQKENEIEILMREGKLEEALRALQSLPPTESNGRLLLEPCLEHRSSVGGGLASQKVRTRVMSQDDPYVKYILGAWDSQCGRPEDAFAELRKAISQNYCAYPQMETDPLLVTIRGKPEFAAISAAGIACRQNFMDHRNKNRFAVP